MLSQSPRFFLLLDATTRGCSVAVMEDNQVLVSLAMHQERTSSSKLTVLIEQAIRLADLTLADLSGVVVGKGPGSYTGLRIAVSTAKGLCFGLDIPLYGVDSLAAMAADAQKRMPVTTARPILLAPMIDARRMEVYTGLYSAAVGELVAPVEALILSESTWDDWVVEYDIWFFGDGAAKVRDLWLGRPGFYFVDQPVAPQAEMYVEAGFAKIQAGLAENLVAFEPYYLKEFFTPMPKKK